MSRALLVVCLVLAPRVASAHKPSDAHLHLAIDRDQIDARLEIAVRDLDGALLLDDNGDGEITWEELEDAAPRIDAYVASRLQLAADGRPCTSEMNSMSLTEHSDGPYCVIPIIAHCAGDVHEIGVTYNLLFDLDAQHRGLIHLSGGKGKTLIVRDATPVSASLGDSTSIADFIKDGVRHIWGGLDHLLFLTCLLLPAVYVPRRHASPGRNVPVHTLRSVTIDVFEIVTAFTLAHSITLVISAVGFVRLPSHFIETAIALSVVAAALNNLVRLVDARWVVAFSLGLLHGFGFSSVLVDLGLPSHELIGALLGFNLGVELGQSMFVLALLPVLYLIRNTVLYRVVLWGGSAGIAVLALVWSFQRWSA